MSFFAGRVLTIYFIICHFLRPHALSVNPVPASYALALAGVSLLVKYTKASIGYG